MRNQLQDLRTLSTPSRVSKTHILFITGIFFVILFSPTFVFADVFIPLHEYLGYFDSSGVYTVVGNIKNENNFAVLPIVTVSVVDDAKILSKTINHVPLGPDEEIPFKIKFPELKGNTPILKNPELTFEETRKNKVPIQVLYDQTLVKHDDGHISGRIQNVGNETIEFPTTV